MKEQKAIIKIKGREFLLMNDVMQYGTIKLKDEALRKLGCIRQGAEKVSPATWMQDGFVIMNYYVPVNKIDEFYKVVK